MNWRPQRINPVLLLLTCTQHELEGGVSVSGGWKEGEGVSLIGKRKEAPQRHKLRKKGKRRSFGGGEYEPKQADGGEPEREKNGVAERTYTEREAFFFFPCEAVTSPTLNPSSSSWSSSSKAQRQSRPGGHSRITIAGAVMGEGKGGKRRRRNGGCDVKAI